MDNKKIQLKKIKEHPKISLSILATGIYLTGKIRGHDFSFLIDNMNIIIKWISKLFSFLCKYISTNKFFLCITFIIIGILFCYCLRLLCNFKIIKCILKNLQKSNYNIEINNNKIFISMNSKNYDNKKSKMDNNIIPFQDIESEVE